jgi:hypothetical protein
MCKHAKLISRIEEEQAILQGESGRRLDVEVAHDLARSLRKRESSKMRGDPCRDEVILSSIPVNGSISPANLLKLITAHPSFPPSGGLQDGAAAAAPEHESAESNTTESRMDQSDESGESDESDHGSRTLSGHYTDPSLLPGTVVEFWWPRESYVGMIVGRLAPTALIDQFEGTRAKQKSIIHRPSAYEVMFEDESSTLGLCLPRELNYSTDGDAGGRQRKLNEWAVLSRLPDGNPTLEAKAKELGVSTVADTIAPLRFRTEPASIDVVFNAPISLGTTFVLGGDGLVRIHSFCQQLGGAPGPAPYSIANGPKHTLAARDVVSMVDGSLLSDVPVERRMDVVAGLVGPVTLRITPSGSATPAVVTMVQHAPPANPETVPLDPLHLEQIAASVRLRASSDSRATAMLTLSASLIHVPDSCVPSLPMSGRFGRSAKEADCQVPTSAFTRHKAQEHQAQKNFLADFHEEDECPAWANGGTQRRG